VEEVPEKKAYDFGQRLYITKIIQSNATFNNISVISLRSVLLVEEIGENQVTEQIYHIQRLYITKIIQSMQ
jgi:ABC-type branched-subunit amino acid transport system substrate-binding protein